MLVGLKLLAAAEGSDTFDLASQRGAPAADCDLVGKFAFAAAAVEVAVAAVVGKNCLRTQRAGCWQETVQIKLAVGAAATPSLVWQVGFVLELKRRSLGLGSTACRSRVSLP